MIPDPLFDDAPESGGVVTSPSWSKELSGYVWRKAEGTACTACGELIEGRRYQVAHARITHWWDNETGTLKENPPEWHHVRCVPQETWWAWLGPVARGAQKDTYREGPKPGTKTWFNQVAKAVEKGTQVQLSFLLLEGADKKGTPVPEALRACVA